MKKAIRRSAYLLIATGILHNLIGVGFGFQVLAEMFREGLFNTTQMQFDREAIFWFLFSGFAMMLWGVLMINMQRIPPVFSWSLLSLSIVGLFIMPFSGFWLVIPQAVYMLYQSRQSVAFA